MEAKISAKDAQLKAALAANEKKPEASTLLHKQLKAASREVLTEGSASARPDSCLFQNEELRVQLRSAQDALRQQIEANASDIPTEDRSRYYSATVYLQQQLLQVTAVLKWLLFWYLFNCCVAQMSRNMEVVMQEVRADNATLNAELFTAKQELKKLREQGKSVS